MSLELALSFAAAGFGGLALFMVGLFWRRLDGGERRFGQLEGKLTEFRVEVAGQYVRATALDSFRREVLDHLERIERKVDAGAGRV
jgi:hypothetical protein